MVRRIFWGVVLLSIGCTPDYELEAIQEAVEATAPDLVVTPSAVDFGAAEVGESITTDLLLTNAGNDNLSVESVLVDNPNVTPSPPALPILIEPGKGALVDLTWNASTDLTATVTLHSNDPDQPEYDVPLIGRIAIPRLELDPDAVNFSEIPPLCEEYTDVLLMSVGDAPLVIDDAGVTGEWFSLLEDIEFPITLDPGDSIGVQVGFAPEDEGDFTGLLTVESNDPSGDVSATLEGLSRTDSTCDGVTTTEMEFEVRYERADVAFILDNTMSMEPVIDAFESQLGAIAGGLSGTIPDLTIGFARHEDYRPDPFTDSRPFRMQQQQTSDIALASATIAAPLPHISGGSDWEEASLEALYQAASGTGYDQNCNASFDLSEDVPPFVPSPLDAFFGTAAGTYNPSIPGTGELGGMGFREGVLPIFVSATDAGMKDPDAGLWSPGGCPRDATLYDAVNEVLNLGGKFVGVEVLSGGLTSPLSQMEALAIITDSYGDLDGDFIEEPMVTSWSPSDSAESFGTNIVEAIEALAAAAVFDVVKLNIQSDVDNVVIDIQPEQYETVVAGTPLIFTITVTGRVAKKASSKTSEVVFELVADDTLVLAERTMFVEP